MPRRQKHEERLGKLAKMDTFVPLGYQGLALALGVITGMAILGSMGRSEVNLRGKAGFLGKSGQGGQNGQIGGVRVVRREGSV